MISFAFKVFFFALLLTQSSFEAEQRAWRETRNAELRTEDSWLAVAGLSWLKEGSNSFGAGKSMNIVLPPGSAPENVGTLELAHGVVTLRVADGVVVKVVIRLCERMKFDSTATNRPRLS